MRRLLMIALLALPLAAQVQVAKSQTTVTGTTGAMVCTATSPTLPNVVLKCVNGAEVSTYTGPISVEWEDAGMDRLHGAKHAVEFVRSLLWEVPTSAFDAAFSSD